MSTPCSFRRWVRDLRLRPLGGLTFPAVADRLGRTVPSVKNQWVRALALLRPLLGGLDETG